MLGPGRTFLTVALGQAVVYCYADLSTSDPASAARGGWRWCALYTSWTSSVRNGADAVPGIDFAEYRPGPIPSNGGSAGAVSWTRNRAYYRPGSVSDQSRVSPAAVWR